MNMMRCEFIHRLRSQAVAGAVLTLIIAAVAVSSPASATAAPPDNVFVQGTLLHGSFGLRFGPDGFSTLPRSRRGSSPSTPTPDSWRGWSVPRAACRVRRISPSAPTARCT